MDGSCEILATQVDQNNGTYMILVKQYKNRESSLYWLVYNEAGEEIANNQLNGLNVQNILSCDITFTSTNETLLIGTYNYAKESRRQSVATYTDGVFISKIKNATVDFVKFHPYSKLTNAFRYLEQHQWSVSKKKVEKERKRT